MIIFCRRYGKVQLRGNLSATLFTAPSQNSTTAFGPHPFSEPMLIFTLTFSIFNSYLHKTLVSLNSCSLLIYKKFIVIYSNYSGQRDSTIVQIPPRGLKRPQTSIFLGLEAFLKSSIILLVICS